MDDFDLPFVPSLVRRGLGVVVQDHVQSDNWTKLSITLMLIPVDSSYISEAPAV
jgi:hypothetical protein